MIYVSAALTKTGQATIPKVVRDILGIDPKHDTKVFFREEKNGTITITKEPSEEDFWRELDSLKSPESLAREKEIREKYRNLSMRERQELWEQSPEGKAYLKKEFVEKYVN